MLHSAAWGIFYSNLHLNSVQAGIDLGSGIWDLGSGIWDLGSPVETLLLRTCMGRTSHTVNIDNCNSNLYLVLNRSNVSMILEQPEVSAISFPLHFLGISEVN